MKDEFCVLVTASNDGFIKLWKLNLEVLCIFLACKYNTTVSWTILYIKYVWPGGNTLVDQYFMLTLSSYRTWRLLPCLARWTPLPDSPVFPSGNLVKWKRWLQINLPSLKPLKVRLHLSGFLHIFTGEIQLFQWESILVGISRRFCNGFKMVTQICWKLLCLKVTSVWAWR